MKNARTPHPIAVTLATNLTELRKHHGTPHTRLARYFADNNVTMTPQSLRRIESLQRRVSADELYLFAKFWKTTMDTLLTEQD